MEVEESELINVWQDKTDELKEEIIDFWLQEEALPAGLDPGERVEQVAFISRNKKTGKLEGISTVYEQFNRQYENYFYFFRVFVSVKVRKKNLAKKILIAVKDYFESQFIDGLNTRSIGMMLEIQNKGIQKYYNEAIWPDSYFVFVGKNKSGAHCRVYYFKDARIS